jgi:two-component system, NarL family, sensor histidine kinase UhpB
LIRGRFMNLVKWGGIIYLFFMLLVLAAMAAPGKQLLGLDPMHYVYLGTFVDVIIFSYAMSLKIRESLNKAAEVRQNLSRDLHDEVGATLTGIRVFGQLARDRPETTAANLEKINSYSEEMLNKMSDIVWALNPDNDSMDRMISKLHNYAVSVTSAKDIELEFRVDEHIRKKSMDMQVRKNLYLLSKEAVNNAVKYAGCKKIKFLLEAGARSGTLSIEDDGIGFDRDRENNGNGLRNMQNRAAEINGKLNIESGPGKGTVIQLLFNFT